VMARYYRYQRTSPLSSFLGGKVVCILGRNIYSPPLADKKETHRPVLAVPIPNANEGTLPQGVPGVEGTAEDLVGGDQEGDGAMEELLEGPGSSGGREMQQGGTELPSHHGCREVNPGPG
jgi:hypothetical protein